MTGSGSSAAPTSAARAISGNVHRIQNQYTITPLSKFGTRYKPRTAAGRSSPSRPSATIPGHPAGRGSARLLCRARQGDAEVPGARSRSAAARPAQGGRHRPRAQSRERAAQRRHAARPAGRRHTGAQQGPVRRAGALPAGFAKHNGYLVTDLGAWGTNYTLRAIGDRLGVGGQRASIATYPVALFDNTKAPLTGSNRYVLHIPKSSLPIPVKAFWSLTMYDTNSFFVPNPLNRYLINNRSHLHTNPDGSIDIYVQHDKPSNPAQVEQLAARARARARVSSDLAPV